VGGGGGVRGGGRRAAAAASCPLPLTSTQPASLTHAVPHRQVLVRGAGGAISHRLVKIERPLMRIPMLAIHLNRWGAAAPPPQQAHLPPRSAHCCWLARRGHGQHAAAVRLNPGFLPAARSLHSGVAMRVLVQCPATAAYPPCLPPARLPAGPSTVTASSPTPRRSWHPSWPPACGWVGGGRGGGGGMAAWVVPGRGVGHPNRTHPQHPSPPAARAPPPAVPCRPHWRPRQAARQRPATARAAAAAPLLLAATSRTSTPLCCWRCWRSSWAANPVSGTARQLGSRAAAPPGSRGGREGGGRGVAGALPQPDCPLLHNGVPVRRVQVTLWTLS
jgi:hypothetical protein